MRYPTREQGDVKALVRSGQQDVLGSAAYENSSCSWSEVGMYIQCCATYPKFAPRSTALGLDSLTYLVPAWFLVNLASSADLAGPASPDSSSQFSPFEWVGMEEEKPKD